MGTSGSRRWTGLDVGGIAGLLLVAVAFPAIVGVVSGSIAIPANDDWSYRRIALHWATTGHFELDGFTVMTIVGQVAFVQPFLWLTNEATAFAIAGIVFATAAILAASALGRVMLPTRFAFVAVAVLPLAPGFLAFDTSFMTDTPALAAQLGCLALGAVAIRRRPVDARLLVASMVVGFLGFSIREFALAAPTAVLLAALVADRRDRRLWLLAAGTVAAFGLFYAWRLSLPDQGLGAKGQLGVPTKWFRGMASLALLLSPVVIVASIRLRHDIRRVELALGLAIAALVAIDPLVHVLSGRRIPGLLLGNPISIVGAYPPGYLPGGRDELFSRAQWDTLQALSWIAVMIGAALAPGLIAVVLRRASRSLRTLVGWIGTPAGMLCVYTAGMLAGLAIYGTAGYRLYERYVWPVLVPAAIVLMLPFRVPSTRRFGSVDVAFAGAAAAFALALALASGALVLNASAASVARWHAGEQLAAAGVPADRIDAGYEWVGYHASGRGSPRATFYRGWWPGLVVCGVVSSQPDESVGYQLVGATTYRTMLFRGRQVTLYAYRIASPECATAASSAGP